MTTFAPTHRITTDRTTIEVMLVDGSAYSAAEWEATDAADYTRDPKGRWLFQGQPFSGSVATIAADSVTHITTIMRVGQVYRSDDLTLMGWTDGDGTGADGYCLADYLDAEGKYLGPDVHGIEPMVRIAGYVRRPYRIAFMLEATGDFEVVEEFEALDHADANRYAETNYGDEPWYVLDTDGQNINS